MTVAFDAILAAATFTTTDPYTFVHTPVGTPRAALVLIGHGTNSTDAIDGTVSYGGVAMARIATAADAAGEPGRVYLYFLGAGIPTGAQTVSIDHSASVVVKKATSVTLTASADTEIVVSGILQGDQADPQIALDTGAISSLRIATLYSGQGDFSNLTAVSGATNFGGNDYGNFLVWSQRQDAAATGSFTIGWTALTDDVAMIGVAVQEVQAVTAAPFPYIGGGYYPTEG